MTDGSTPTPAGTGPTPEDVEILRRRAESLTGRERAELLEEIDQMLARLDERDEARGSD